MHQLLPTAVGIPSYFNLNRFISDADRTWFNELMADTVNVYQAFKHQNCVTVCFADV